MVYHNTVHLNIRDKEYADPVWRAAHGYKEEH